MNRKNVVLIVLDSLRRDRLSVYNQEVDFTDNIQSFSEDSEIYSQAVANSSWTLPSHASIFTGMYPWEHGATQQNLSLEVEKPLLAEKLTDAGYRSAAFSTNAWLSGKFGITNGFSKVDNMSSTGFSEKLSKLRRMMDDWLASEGQGRLKRYLVRAGNYLFHYRSDGSKTEEVFEQGKKFIEDGNKPFLLFFNLMDAHEPYFPPEEYRKKHDAPEPREICQDPTDYHFNRKEPDFERIKRIYDASVDYMDDRIGEFFKYLKEEELWDETVAVVVSDHGQMLGENDEYGHQFSVAEPLVHVPMLIKGSTEGEVDEQVELRELYDIILDYAGIEDGYQPGSEFALGGYDFPDMMRPRIPPDRWTDFYQRHRFVRTKDGKIIVSENENGEKEDKFEYGGELSEEKKELLREKLENIVFSDEEGEGLEEQEDEIKKQLENLGYGQK